MPCCKEGLAPLKRPQNSAASPLAACVASPGPVTVPAFPLPAFVQAPNQSYY